MASLKTITRGFLSSPVRLAYLATLGLFLWLAASFYVPGKGFTAFIRFGDKTAENYLPELKAMDFYVEADSYGYDAQHYVQIAVRPEVRDPELAVAVDNISYRARRILFSWTAWILGGGNPTRTVHIFAIQNVVCWLVLAGVLLRWFPATGWENYLRWVGVLFSYGVWFSVRGALVDGPSLLLISVGVALAEKGRTGWSAIVLGIAGLAKETNILAGGVLLQLRERTPMAWLRIVARAVLLLVPLVLWGTLLWSWFGQSGGAGERNFAQPLTGYFEKWRSALTDWSDDSRHPLAYASVLWLITVTIQFLFIALRPRWNDLWWRVGAAFAVLMIFLGDAVWEGHPGAAGRVLLPMALAFNILLPRGRGWLILLLLGNLTIFGIGETLKLPGSQSVEVSGPPELLMDAASGKRITVEFPQGWYSPERSRWEYWRWSDGPAEVVVSNPHDDALVADVSFGLRSKNPRTVIVRTGDQVLWTGIIGDDVTNVSRLRLRFPPGQTFWRFETDQDARSPGPRDPRPVAFSLRNLELKFLFEEK